MKTFLPTLVAFLFLAAAGAAVAQSPAPQQPQPQQPATPASQPPEGKAASERPPLNLNLRLDDASRHRIMSGSTEERTGGGAALPSLGGDVRPIDRTPRPESVFPKESTSNVPTPH